MALVTLVGGEGIQTSDLHVGNRVRFKCLLPALAIRPNLLSVIQARLVSYYWGPTSQGLSFRLSTDVSLDGYLSPSSCGGIYWEP